MVKAEDKMMRMKGVVWSSWLRGEKARRVLVSGLTGFSAMSKSRIDYCAPSPALLLCMYSPSPLSRYNTHTPTHARYSPRHTPPAGFTPRAPPSSTQQGRQEEGGARSHSHH